MKYGLSLIAVLTWHSSLAQDWYVEVGAGARWAGDPDQDGYVHDTTCYPTNLCPPVIDGYAWHYDLEVDSAARYAVAVGRSSNGYRLELAASGNSGPIRQHFTGIEYLNGPPVQPDPDSRYGSVGGPSIDRFRNRTLAFNAYREFPIARTAVTPYVGLGLGVSRVELAGFEYRNEYHCNDVRCPGRPASEFNALQRVDLGGTVASGQAYAGLDYPLSGDRVVLSLRATFRMMGDLEAEAGYIEHPIPDLRNHTTISGMRDAALTLGVRFLIASDR